MHDGPAAGLQPAPGGICGGICLANGSISIEAKADGQYVTQADNNIIDHKEESETVITQTITESAPTTTNTVTIEAEAGATAEVTLKDVNIDVRGTGTGSPWNGVSGEAAVQTKGDGNVTIDLDGENTVQSGLSRAGLEKNNGGNLTITDENDTAGRLEATGGMGGAGIGGGSGQSVSNITIEGNAEVTANGGEYASGIGGGEGRNGSNITITGSAIVTAKGGDSGAGIGGGSYHGTGMGEGSNITVSGDAQVKAQGGEKSDMAGAGAAIGNGGELDNYSQTGKEIIPNTEDLNEGWVATYDPSKDMKNDTPVSLTYRDTNRTVISATENIQLEAENPVSSTTHGHEAGFMVGNELVAVTIHNYGDYASNPDATCTHDGTKTATCTVPGCTATHTIPDPGTMLEHEFVNYVPDADNRATCTQNGTKTATCENCSATKTILDPAQNHSVTNCGEEDTIPDVGSALTHSFTNYVSDGKATCTQDGSKIAECDNGCGATDTITDVGSALGHSFTHYVSNNDATYLKDGTKTAKCDHPGCDATDTITDPGTRLPAPLYRVIGKEGQGVSCETERKDGVLTITVEEDSASLTGYLGGLQSLRTQGIDTIVFVTNGATSTFAVADLMAGMTAGDSYTLTHDGSTVTFTLSSGTDISGILK